MCLPHPPCCNVLAPGRACSPPSGASSSAPWAGHSVPSAPPPAPASHASPSSLPLFLLASDPPLAPLHSVPSPALTPSPQGSPFPRFVPSLPVPLLPVGHRDPSCHQAGQGPPWPGPGPAAGSASWPLSPPLLRGWDPPQTPAWMSGPQGVWEARVKAEPPSAPWAGSHTAVPRLREH